MIDPFGMCAEPGSGTKSKSFVQKLKGLGKSIKKGYKKLADAGLSAAAFVPIIGDEAGAGKLAVKGVKAEDKVDDVADAWKDEKVNGVRTARTKSDIRIF